jgi:hypothetical protein
MVIYPKNVRVQGQSLILRGLLEEESEVLWRLAGVLCCF